VPTNWPENRGLAKWVHRQREHNNKGRLQADRKQQLEAIGFIWKSDNPARQEKWQQRFTELLAFKARFGHTRMPAKWKENKSLGHWVHVQREFRKKGMLSAERMARLAAVGFEWSEPGRLGATHQEHNEKRWTQLFEQMCQFKQYHGHCNVLTDWPENPPLAGWVQRQRLLHRLGTLPPARHTQLEALGFVWEADNSAQRLAKLADDQRRWEQALEQLRQFKERSGHCRPSLSVAEERWLAVSTSSKMSRSRRPSRPWCRIVMFLSAK